MKTPSPSLSPARRMAGKAALAGRVDTASAAGFFTPPPP
jgi:hypothetical protein